jgi:small subunit ribosomal protein S4
LNKNRKNVAKGKLVRKLGINLFEQPKYDKLLKKKPHAPGMHGPKKKRTKQTEYGKQLIEKQKLKFAYGVSERQIRNIFEKAKTMPGITGDSMLSLLERRLDNVVFRLGLASSRAQARQMVGHGHFHVNGRVVNIPSYSVRGGDVVAVKERESVKKLVRDQYTKNSGKAKSSWINFAEDALQATVDHIPRREEIPTIANEQMVVELYAK